MRAQEPHVFMTKRGNFPTYLVKRGVDTRESYADRTGKNTDVFQSFETFFYLTMVFKKAQASLHTPQNDFFEASPQATPTLAEFPNRPFLVEPYRIKFYQYCDAQLSTVSQH